MTISPFVRPAWREAVGIVLRGDAATQSQLALAWRFLRGLSPEIRRACSDSGDLASRRLASGAEGERC